MALISSIRNRSWILIVFIGIGLASFIMMDMFGSDTSAFGNRPSSSLGSINGKDIDYNKAKMTEEVFYKGASGSTYGLKDLIWNYYLEESILNDEGQKLGLNVGKDELNDLMFGNNLSPVVQSVFRNRQTGQVDMASLLDIKNKVQTDRSQINEGYMIELVGQVKKNRMQEKYTSLISQGFYTPNWMAEQVAAERNLAFDFNYVKIPFSDVEDSQVTVSDTDYSTYLADNKSTYMSDEETRKINYVVFDVFPSQADSSKYFGDLQGKVNNFRALTNSSADSTYVLSNGGTMAGNYVKQSSLSPEIKNDMFNLPVGSVVGPYTEGTSYKLAKISDRKLIADSIKAQHILITADPRNSDSFSGAITRIDSIRTALNNGASFENLAAQVSQDRFSADKGGDLGVFGQGSQPRPINDLVFYSAAEGSVNMVMTQRGVHLVKVNDKIFSSNEESVKIAYLTRSITPSDATQKAIRERVQEFVNNHNSATDLDALIASEPNLNIQTTTNLKQNDYIIPALGQDPSSREMVRWAFNGNTDTGDLSPDFYIYRYSNPITYENYDSKYVIASLMGVQKAGLPSVESIKSNIASLVINQKKAAFIASSISNKELEAVASQYGTSVDNLQGISASSTSVGVLGNEPKVVAALANLQVNQKSAPIQGANGVYVVQLVNRSDNSGSIDLASIKRQQSSKVKSQAVAELMKALKDGAEVTDNRFSIY